MLPYLFAIIKFSSLHKIFEKIESISLFSTNSPGFFAMHKIKPGKKYNIEQCKDPMCNICTSTDGWSNPGIIVYTCSNPTCSLCEGDYSLLLDIIQWDVSPEEYWTPMQEQLRMTSSNKLDVDNPLPETMARRESEKGIKRKSSEMTHDAEDTAKRRSINNNLIKNGNDELINAVDDNQLMNLARELEVDKMQYLPELHKDVITVLTMS